MCRRGAFLSLTAVLFVSVFVATVTDSVAALLRVVAVVAAATRELTGTAFETAFLVVSEQGTVPNVIAVLVTRITLFVTQAARKLTRKTETCKI